MKVLKQAAALAALSLVLGNPVTAGAASGVIRFSGRVVVPTSIPLTYSATAPADEAVIRQVYTLRDAQRILATDVLDYFATYAPTDARLVSVTYD